jgi:hypothetical protein
MDIKIITNNSAVYDAYGQAWTVEYLEDRSFMQVLVICRDEIHKGRRLLTHPLTGSIKPNETPFKSIMLSSDKGDVDTESLLMIESAIEVTRKFLNNAEIKNWPPRMLDDFRVIDYQLITSGIESVNKYNY